MSSNALVSLVVHRLVSRWLMQLFFEVRFGSPHTDFVFDAMVARCWRVFPSTSYLKATLLTSDAVREIASGRFGARAMRTCMESPLVSRFQKVGGLCGLVRDEISRCRTDRSEQRRVAAAIIANSIPLATNTNGSLCLTVGSTHVLCRLMSAEEFSRF
jgi:protein JSN1